MAVVFLLLLGLVYKIEERLNPIKPTVITASENENELLGISQKQIVYGDKTKKQVIFTFDAGDGNVSLPGILEVLHKHGVKGTFFMTGKFVINNPDLVKKVVAEGHEIFNHTYDHPHLTELKNMEIVDQLDRMNTALVNAVGVRSKPYFRPPYGDIDGRVIHAAFFAGYQPIYWTVDARDWMNDITKEEVKWIIESNVAPGVIYLMHVGDKITSEILDEEYTKIEKMGYKIVSLSDGLPKP